jgi:hypothetical protein
MSGKLSRDPFACYAREQATESRHELVGFFMDAFQTNAVDARSPRRETVRAELVEVTFFSFAFRLALIRLPAISACRTEPC